MLSEYLLYSGRTEWLYCEKVYFYVQMFPYYILSHVLLMNVPFCITNIAPFRDNNALLLFIERNVDI